MARKVGKCVQVYWKMVAMAMMMAYWVSRPGAVEAEVTCGQVTQWLTPCIGYAIYGGSVAPECCTGIKSLVAAATTTQDRRNSCSCIKQAISSMPGINYDLVAQLPDKCGATVPYKISPSIDCSKVN